MKKINLDDTHVINGSTTKKNFIKIWEKNFVHDTSKFLGSSRLKPYDLGKTFKDVEGAEWKIVGLIEVRDLACEKLSTGEIFVWDKWKVSLLMHPEEHAKMNRKVEYVQPKKERKTRKKSVAEENKPDESQLDLFK